MDMLFIGILTVTTRYVHGRSHELEHDDMNNFAVLHVLPLVCEKMMTEVHRSAGRPPLDVSCTGELPHDVERPQPPRHRHRRPPRARRAPRAAAAAW